MPPEATEEDVAFLWKHLRLGAGSRVLDVPCGDGRLSLPLAARECSVTAVDISREFLDPARRSAAERGLTVDFRQSEMRDLRSEEEFDAAFCFGNSFGFLDDAGNAAFLEAVGRALAPGGRFAVDYGQAAESVFPRLTPKTEAKIGEFRFIEENRYDALSGRMENRYVFTRGGESETKLASQRVYTVSEVVRLLERAGFGILDIFGSPRDEPFALGSPRLLIVAEKRSGAAPSGATRG